MCYIPCAGKKCAIVLFNIFASGILNILLNFCIVLCTTVVYLCTWLWVFGLIHKTVTSESFIHSFGWGPVGALVSKLYAGPEWSQWPPLLMNSCFTGYLWFIIATVSTLRCSFGWAPDESLSNEHSPSRGDVVHLGPAPSDPFHKQGTWGWRVSPWNDVKAIQTYQGQIGVEKSKAPIKQKWLKTVLVKLMF